MSTNINECLILPTTCLLVSSNFISLVLLVGWSNNYTVFVSSVSLILSVDWSSEIQSKSENPIFHFVSILNLLVLNSTSNLEPISNS